MVEEDALFNQSSESWCHMLRTSERFDKLSAKSLHDDEQDIRPFCTQQGIGQHGFDGHSVCTVCDFGLQVAEILVLSAKPFGAFETRKQ